jgi:gluconolactonase
MDIPMTIGRLAIVLLTMLAGQDFSTVKVEPVAAGFPGGEGPVWSRAGYLLFSDYSRDRIYKYVPGGEPEVYREDSHGTNGNTMDAQGRLYSCEYKSRRVTRTDRNGRIEVLADRFEGKRFNAPNDIVVSKAGHVYFTDPAFGSQADHRELDFYGVYHLPPKGPLKLVAKPGGRPNGIALSPNGRILYVSNSDERNVRAYDLDKNGETANERVLISGIKGVPGGMRVDEKGNLYIAADGLAIYSPEAKLLHTIELHSRPSNCAFGEVDYHTLFITERGSVYRTRLDVKGAY